MMPKDQLKCLLTNVCMAVLILLTLTAVLLHFYRLDKVPYGFHVDEMSGSVAIGCLATEGLDAHNIPHPLFANLNYGTPKPPVYLYPAAVWSKFFGYSVPSLRALSVTVHLLGIVGLFFLAQSLFGWRYALLTVSIAIISPWAWVESRVAFESLFAVTFMVWGLYFLMQESKVWRMILAGMLMAGAMYSYPPMRLQTPLMLIPLCIYCWKHYRLRFKHIAAFTIAFVIMLIPLVQYTLNGKLQERFNTISIFSHDYLNSIGSNGNWFQLVQIFAHIFALHFQPEFLFTKGDLSYVHSTRHFGILSWMDMAALGLGALFLLMLLTKSGRKDNPILVHGHLLILCIVCIIIGVIPAALTNSEVPNSLRIMGSWPFMCLLSSFLLWQACERWWGMWLPMILLTVVFAFAFLKVYFVNYPQESKGMFEFMAYEMAQGIKTDEDWLRFIYIYHREDYHCRYYLMQYRHLSCTQTRVMWESMRDLLKAQNKY